MTKIIALKAVAHHDPETGRNLLTPFCLATDLPDLEAAIEQTPDCRLVVVDPITAYLGRADGHKNAELRGLLAPLGDLAGRHRVAVVAVTHHNKNAQGPALYRAMGSLAFVAAARAAWTVTKDKDDPRRRLVLPVKNNLAADVLGLAYTIEPFGPEGAPVVAWDSQPVELSADDALAADGADDDGRNAQDEAVAWIKDTLGGGPLPAKVVKDAAAGDGIAGRTLDRAKRKLGVVAEREGFGRQGRWIWRLLHSAPTDAIERHPETVAHNGELGAL